MTLAVALFVAAGLAWGQSAEDIVRASRDRIKANTTSTRSRMVITAKDGSTTERLVDEYSADTKDGNRAVIVFQKPASIAGTRFLTMENPGKDSDRWIYLPSLGKVRRVAASEGSGNFMGTDMSYDDISSLDRDVDLDVYTLLREEPLGGKDCWVIEAKPKDPSYQYSRMVAWIEMATNVSLKMELYGKKGELSKVMEILETKDVQGRLTPTTTRMTTVAAKTSTTIYVEVLKYDEQIPASVFTTKFLETGRP
jgi:outer membrane lipoprotein-sorting protein